MIAQTVGFLRSYFTWFIHLSVSHMIGTSYIYQMLWCVSSGKEWSDQIWGENAGPFGQMSAKKA